MSELKSEQQTNEELAKAEEEALSAARDTWDAVETAKANVRSARAVKMAKVRTAEEANAVWAKALEAQDKAKEDAWAEQEGKARQMEL